ncbi:hypothetical protein EVAR_43824_1 [Eumeta japonica]|uniref:Uncharacterized protein n=1 Tax=Eumeta variegata TaxID=151549 RepID=A0A4C1WZC9_EUMVA|nr:hypothetical protein EVAR_43824_1 [Eumeta japonica]
MRIKSLNNNISGESPVDQIKSYENWLTVIEIEKYKIITSDKFTFVYSTLASARGFARVDFEHIPLSIYRPFTFSIPVLISIPVCLAFDFDHSLAFNPEPGLGLNRLGLRGPALISDLGAVPYSDSEHALGFNFNSTFDSNHGFVLDSVLVRSRLSIPLFVLFAISSPLPLTVLI